MSEGIRTGPHFKTRESHYWLSPFLPLQRSAQLAERDAEGGGQRQQSTGGTEEEGDMSAMHIQSKCTRFPVHLWRKISAHINSSPPGRILLLQYRCHCLPCMHVWRVDEARQDIGRVVQSFVKDRGQRDIDKVRVRHCQVEPRREKSFPTADKGAITRGLSLNSGGGEQHWQRFRHGHTSAAAAEAERERCSAQQCI